MIKRFYLIGIFVAVVNATSEPEIINCQPNEVLVTNLGKISCENTCTDPYIGASCTALITRPTCRCKPGYLRNSKGECVLPPDCQNCKPNEELVVNLGKITCENTCINPNKGASCTALITSPTCRCKPGYLRNSKGECVLPADCDNCKPNEELVVRLGKITCENTCINPNIGESCTAIITRPTCRCKPGYLRNSKGECVLPANCDNCKPNEELVVRLGKITCENTCINPNIGESCTALITVPTCRCKEGYLRNSKGECVLPADCDNCKSNEMLVVRLGKISCENTCKNPNIGTRCTALISRPTCRCKQGYLRNSKGECVLPADCN